MKSALHGDTNGEEPPHEVGVVANFSTLYIPLFIKDVIEMYWNINDTLSHNMFLNIICGIRNVGKTYGCKEWSIKDFKKTKGEFIYVRRYKEELTKEKREKYFDDIRDKFPDDELEVKNKTAFINGETAGHFIFLSTAQTLKSVPFPNVNKIIFDEFLITKSVYHYLPNEVNLFLELLETVIRQRDNVKIFMLGNALSINNPYFIYWNLQPPKLGIRYKDKKRGILLEMAKDEELIKQKKATNMGHLIAGTKYESYALENEFLDDNTDFIEKKTGQCNFYFAFKFKGFTYGVWIDYNAGKMFVSNDVDPFCKFVYSITLADHSPNTLLIKSAKKSFYLKSFIENYQIGNVRFESAKIKAVASDMIKLMMF